MFAQLASAAPLASRVSARPRPRFEPGPPRVRDARERVLRFADRDLGELPLPPARPRGARRALRWQHRSVPPRPRRRPGRDVQLLRRHDVRPLPQPQAPRTPHRRGCVGRVRSPAAVRLPPGGPSHVHATRRPPLDATADNVRVFHGREVRSVPWAPGGGGMAIHLSFAGEPGADDPEGWTGEEVDEYAGWLSDRQRRWRDGLSSSRKGSRRSASDSDPRRSPCTTGFTSTSTTPTSFGSAPRTGARAWRRKLSRESAISAPPRDRSSGDGRCGVKEKESQSSRSSRLSSGSRGDARFTRVPFPDPSSKPRTRPRLDRSSDVCPSQRPHGVFVRGALRLGSREDVPEAECLVPRPVTTV